MRPRDTWRSRGGRGELSTRWKGASTLCASPTKAAGFRGFQRQPGLPTVQDALEGALLAAGVRAALAVAARTDAGVHALDQVVSFSARAALEPDALRRALNAALPDGIVVLEALPCRAVVPRAEHGARSPLRLPRRCAAPGGARGVRVVAPGSAGVPGASRAAARRRKHARGARVRGGDPRLHGLRATRRAARDGAHGHARGGGRPRAGRRSTPSCSRGTASSAR